MHRRFAELRDVQVGFEGVELVAERIAPHGDVEAAEGLLPVDRVQHGVGEHDEAGAGAVHRHPVGDPGLERLGQTEGAAELVHDARLAARDHQAVDLGELALPPDRHGIRSEFPQHGEVLAEIALEREDADPSAASALPATLGEAVRGRRGRTR